MVDKEGVIIFGGTSEGRELAEYAAGRNIPVLVSVASEYGRNMMEDAPCLRVRCGRLEEAQMVDMLRQEQPTLVIDATHPHAVEVTRQLAGACRTAGVEYLRVVREPSDVVPESEKQERGAARNAVSESEKQERDVARNAVPESEKQENCAAGNAVPEQVGQERWRQPDETGIYQVDTIGQAAKLLQSDQEPVLLTTGSKELPVFAGVPSLQERIYARVLPDSKVIASCEQMGISGKHLIAMQGPFSEEMNCALIRQTKAGWLVTKESGGRGGFEEKLAAVRACGIKGIVIRRPRREMGVSLEEAKRIVEERLLPGRTAAEEAQKVRLSLIGMGMGLGRQLTAEAMEALEDCEAVLGAPRMLADLAAWTKGRQTAAVYLGKDVYEWVKTHPEYRHIAVIYSGDTGFHSGSRKLCELIRSETETEPLRRIEVKLYPGISTASCLCARLQTTWEDLYFASAHGCDCDAPALLKEHRRVFLLLGGEHGLGKLCASLTDTGLGNTIIKAGERLGYENERIIEGYAKDLCGIRTDPLTAVILEREENGLDEG